MGRLLMVACTNVGRYIIERMMNSSSVKSELVGVVDLNSERAISKANYDAYQDLQIKYNIPVFYCDNVNDAECLAFIREKNPDVILQTGWSQKFRSELLNIPKFGCIGEHPAPLPKGRGAACVNWAILTGENEWGDTFFRMVDEYDKGEMYAQSRFRIEEYDDVFTVYEKVAMCAAETVEANVDDWTNGIFRPIEQNDSAATHYSRRTPADGEIRDFDRSAKELHDFIRAQTHPYPGAFFVRSNSKITVLRSGIVHGEKTELCPGTVCDICSGYITVSCKNGELLKLIRVQRENEPSCWAEDLAKKIGIIPGDVLI